VSTDMRVDVIGSRVSACTLQDALDAVDVRHQQGGGGYVCFTNVHAVVEGRRNPAFRQVTNDSFLSVADGKPVFWVGRAKGARTLGHSPGPDFFREAIRRFPHRRHYFYGSTPAVLAQLEAELRKRQPDINICGMFSPPYRALGPEDLEQHYAAIRASGAEFVWVGLGAPKQELWMAKAATHLPGAVLFGVGAAFDFHAGTVKRAPEGWGRMGLEWLYRLLQEPRRLWKRYLVTNSLFVAYVLQDALRLGPSAKDG
jgi:N-acetylglucosaminyldiphosphoundecaprenol N-acetyl-beta-D-mannosaminyltransferase